MKKEIFFILIFLLSFSLVSSSTLLILSNEANNQDVMLANATHIGIQFKFYIEGYSGTVNDAKVCMKESFGSANIFKIKISNVQNQTWVESDSYTGYKTQPLLANTTNQESTDSSGYSCYNVTEQIKVDFGINENTSIRLYPLNFDINSITSKSDTTILKLQNGTNYMQFSSREGANTPYLSISYNPPPPTIEINSPTNTNYTTTEILFNITSEDELAVDSCTYSLDLTANKTLYQNLSLSKTYNSIYGLYGLSHNGSNYFGTIGGTSILVYDENMNYLYYQDTSPYVATTRGIASYGSYNYVLEASGTEEFHTFYQNGTYVGSCDISSHVESPMGIATDGTYVWIVDEYDDIVDKYTVGCSYQSSINVGSDGITYPEGIAYLSSKLYITDRNSDKIYRYSSAGVYQKDYSMGIFGNNDPYGITSNSGDLVVSDRSDALIYKYKISSGNEYYAYNFSMTQGNHNVTYYCNDTTGMENSSSVSFYIDSISPSIEITNPVNYSSYDVNDLFLNNTITENGIGLDYCWYINHTDSPVFITCGENVSIHQDSDGSYNVSLFANDSLGNVGSNFVEYTISTVAPAIILNSPSDVSYLNYDDVYFNFTATDTNGLDTCNLWGNWTGWHLNYTWNPTSGVMNYTLLTLDNGKYKWNVWCNDTNGDGSYASTNFTTTIDTINPSSVINSITTTAGFQTFYFNSTETDTNLNSCKYSIYNSSNMIDGSNENVSYICNSNPHTATTSVYGNFTLRIYSLDLAGNENYTNANFTTSASSGTTIIISGGGGGETREVAKNFTITSTNYFKNIDVSLAKDSKKARTNRFFITNKRSQSVQLNLICEDQNNITDFDICDYVELTEEIITVSPNENDPYIGTFSLLTPPNSSIGDTFYFNILAESTGEGTKYYSKLSVSSKVSSLGLFYKYSLIPGTEKVYPVALLSAIISLSLFLLVFFTLSKRKMELPGLFLGIGIFIATFFLFSFFL